MSFTKQGPKLNVTADDFIVPKEKVKRNFFTPEQTKKLMAVFESYPIPSRSLREVLALEFNVPENSIKVWFQNHRAKLRNQADIEDILKFRPIYFDQDKGKTDIESITFKKEANNVTDFLPTPADSGLSMKSYNSISSIKPSLVQFKLPKPRTSKKIIKGNRSYPLSSSKSKKKSTLRLSEPLAHNRCFIKPEVPSLALGRKIIKTSKETNFLPIAPNFSSWHATSQSQAESLSNPNRRLRRSTDPSGFIPIAPKVLSEITYSESRISPHNTIPDSNSITKIDEPSITNSLVQDRQLRAPQPSSSSPLNNELSNIEVANLLLKLSF